MSSNSEIIVAHKPTRREFFVIRFLIVLGLLALIQFLWWFFKPGHIGYPPLYWLLTFSLIFKILRMLHEWYHYFSIHVPKRPTTDYNYTVDILTTACPGEPQQMIIDTLEAIQAITYPHTAYLCDEGDDPVLKEACRRLGVVHVTRTEKVNAKAGNINNALRQATGEICVILDPDHIPVPQFLDRVLPYFEDEKIGYVQVVQAYYNKHESIVAYGAAEQTYHFYGPMMMSMDS
ncbi:MAG: cellulose synthase, partial [Cytophagales bacterium CG18_big_fil_WC_8_21_14_2_50_42_9]